LLHIDIFLGLLFNPEDGEDIFFRRDGQFQQTTQHCIPEDRISCAKCIYLLTFPLVDNGKWTIAAMSVKFGMEMNNNQT
jgi:hypothetical protein